MKKTVDMPFKRTKYCGEFSSNDLEKSVCVAGWVAKQRNFGNLIFLDLRDRICNIKNYS